MEQSLLGFIWKWPCVRYFVTVVTKSLTRSSWSFLQLEVASIMAEKAWWQEHEGAGHLSIMRKQKTINGHIQLAFSFLFSVGPLPMKWCHPQSSPFNSKTFPEICFRGHSKSCQSCWQPVINHYRYLLKQPCLTCKKLAFLCTSGSCPLIHCARWFSTGRPVSQS